MLFNKISQDLNKIIFIDLLLFKSANNFITDTYLKFK